MQVRRQQAVPLLVGGLQQRLDEQPGRVVDPDVDPAEAIHRELAQCVDLRRVAGVARDQDAVGAGLPHPGLGRLGAVRIGLVDPCDGSPRRAQRDGDRAADAGRRAGDDRAPATKVERGWDGRRGVGLRAHVRLSRRVGLAATLPARGTLRQRDSPLPGAVFAGEPAALVQSQRGEVDRGLRIGDEDLQRLTCRQARQLPARTDQRQRARQAAHVEDVRSAPYDQCMIAVILESGELQRLYTGLSVLVSAAADGTPARALVGFGALAPILDERLMARGLRPEAAPDVSEAGREAFARTLAELRDTALELPDCRLWACAAAVEATGALRTEIEARLDGVMSTPRFLREVAGADLVVV